MEPAVAMGAAKEAVEPVPAPMNLRGDAREPQDAALQMVPPQPEA